MASPRPVSGRPPSIHAPKGQSGSQTESPLRQTSFPADQLQKKTSQDHALESEVDDDVIHIDPPSHRASKIGGAGYDPPKEDLGPEGGNTEEEGGWVVERGYGVPILASDEVEKHPEAEFRQPAVSPELERRGSGDYTLNDADGVPSYVTGRRSHSRSSSRNNSIHAGNANLQRFAGPAEHDGTGTPLESMKEYEPLFPEDETEKKPKAAADKLKRPDVARHHFPSQDVWEDTPSSLQLETTVETPEVPPEPTEPTDVHVGKVFEKPEKEEARKEYISEEDQKSFLPEHTKRFAKSHLNKDILGDMPVRPGMQQRFPSHDIWEDAPDHGQLVTTVSAPQTEDTNEYADDSPVAGKNPAPAKPSIPARPQKARDISPVDKKAPVIPDKPKPQVPTCPSKPLTKSSEKVPTLESLAEPPQPKAKPAVPARPGGSKIAALQAGFLKDLNSKLGLGPQAPKVKEPEPEKEEEAPKPLQDARKGRAKGPQRRKPTSSTSPAPAATVVAEVAVPRQKLEIAGVNTIWSVGEDGGVHVPAHEMGEKIRATLALPEKDEIVEKSEEKVDESNLPKEVVEKEEVVEPEEAELKKTVSKEEHVVEQKAVEEPEDDVGGVELEKKASAEVPVSAAAEEPKLEEPAEKKASEEAKKTAA
ncbi:hypothetical protein K469DRAFT_325399 [Zopfia rhizophila CBS 207.26]|uniref:Altered inheritance of mitochondria protein 21 n=1 Tax=Zopfia rhizophila CBS 207.26 TaxID=1314779 RepID=A0A6A6DH48_9PEZI|nr:hypothetical protein K469DRAFT_325399 [Zopfia rhizophila CBS 207.26]